MFLLVSNRREFAKLCAALYKIVCDCRMSRAALKTVQILGNNRESTEALQKFSTSGMLLRTVIDPGSEHLSFCGQAPDSHEV